MRVELRLDGTVHARYQGRYVGLRVCEEGAEEDRPTQAKPARQPHKAPNAGGKSEWMKGFWDQPTRRFGVLSENLLRKAEPRGKTNKERRAKTA